MAEQNKRKSYPTDLSDAEWQRIEPHLPKRKSPRGRQRLHSFREILNAIFYVLRSGYAGQLVGWVKTVCDWVLEIIKRTDDVTGFQVLPRRWVVECTFAWLGKYRRLSKDYEYLPESSEAWTYAAMIHIMVRRLAQLQVADS